MPILVDANKTSMLGSNFTKHEGLGEALFTLSAFWNNPRLSFTIQNLKAQVSWVSLGVTPTGWENPPPATYPCVTILGHCLALLNLCFGK